MAVKVRTNGVKVEEEQNPQADDGRKRGPSPNGVSGDKGSLKSAEPGVVLKKSKPVKAPELPKLTVQQVKDFTFVFNTLAIEDVGSGIISLTTSLPALTAAQGRLEEGNIHPLTSMMLFVTTLKSKLVQVHEAFTTWWTIAGVTSVIGQNAWEKFQTEMTEKLTAHHKAKKIEPFLQEFANATKLDLATLKKFVKENKWEEFIKHCLGIE